MRSLAPLLVLLAACGGTGFVSAQGVDAGERDALEDARDSSHGAPDSAEAGADCAGIDPYGDQYVPLECFPSTDYPPTPCPNADPLCRPLPQ